MAVAGRAIQPSELLAVKDLRTRAQQGFASSHFERGNGRPLPWRPCGLLPA